MKGLAIYIISQLHCSKACLNAVCINFKKNPRVSQFSNEKACFGRDLPVWICIEAPFTFFVPFGR